MRYRLTPWLKPCARGLVRASQVIAWVLGEYGAPGSAERAHDVITKLVAVVDQQTVSDSAKGYLLTALAKLCCQTGASLTRDAEVFVRGSASSRNADLQQRALEIQALLSCDAATRAAALPHDASCEDLEVRAVRPRDPCPQRITCVFDSAAAAIPWFAACFSSKSATVL